MLVAQTFQMNFYHKTIPWGIIYASDVFQLSGNLLNIVSMFVVVISILIM